MKNVLPQKEMLCVICFWITLEWALTSPLTKSIVILLKYKVIVWTVKMRIWNCYIHVCHPLSLFTLFVQSTTPSHSLGANVQKVLAMMKSHNSVMCSQHDPQGQQKTCEGQRSSSPSSSTGSSVTSSDQELNDLLSQLQDEFGQLSRFVLDCSGVKDCCGYYSGLLCVWWVSLPIDLCVFHSV